MESKEVFSSESQKETQGPVTNTGADTDKVEPAAQAAEEQVEEVAETKTAELVEKQPEEEVDYSSFNQVELINELRRMVESENFDQLQGKVEQIRVCFYKLHNGQIQEQQTKFVEDGGTIEDFKPEEDLYERDLKSLLRKYKLMKSEYNSKLEEEKEDNYKKKLEIIEEIKHLINGQESINKTFQEFREIQQRWREVGLIPQTRMKEIWETYHHHVEKFYDYIKINRELRDLDLKKNMEIKIGLCEKAEELLISKSIVSAFSELQKYHEQWREVGPVPREKKDEVWERFKAATTQINKKHQDHFESLKHEQTMNLEQKKALCEKVEELLESEISTFKAFDEKSKEIIELQKVWRTIGYAPKKDNNKIYERFRAACDKFFESKRNFYTKNKQEQVNNLQLKTDLCVQAEAIKDSEEWKKTTEELISIQKRWKEIGSVPRKHSDIIWKRFRAACDHFFEKKSAFFSSADEAQEVNLKTKNELIAEVEAFAAGGEDNNDFETLKAFQRRWSDIGHVPIKMKNDVQKRFRAAINAQFDKLRVEDRERGLMKYKSRVNDMGSRGYNKMYAEREKHVIKMKQLENDLITLKNNIGFFSNSKNAEGLIREVEKKITQAEEQIKFVKEKIKIIDQAGEQGE